MLHLFNLKAPFFGPTEPVYPPLMQAVRVTSTTVLGPTTGGYTPILYESFVEQLDPDTMQPRDREACLVIELNGRNLSAGYYNARLAGSYNGLPVYETYCPLSGTEDRVTDVLLLGCSLIVRYGRFERCTNQQVMTWASSTAVPCCCSGSGSGSGTGSGSGSGTGSGSICGCNCDLPNSFSATISGITNGICTNCTSVNGTYTLTHGDINDVNSCCFGLTAANVAGNYCCWCLSGYDGGCGSNFTMILWYDGTNWNFQMGIGESGAEVGILQGTWNCSGTNTFTISNSALGGYCNGSVTITINGQCGSGSGSGTGTGTGSGSGSGSNCCPSWPITIYAVISSAFGTCTPLDGTYALAFDGTDTWGGIVSNGGITLASFRVTCIGGVPHVQIQCGGQFRDSAGSDCSLPQDFGSFTFSTPGGCCNGGFNVSITS